MAGERHGMCELALKGNLCKSNNRKVATLLTARDKAASAFCQRHKEVLFIGEFTNTLTGESSLTLLLLISAHPTTIVIFS
jgi:hypothetical protein